MSTLNDQFANAHGLTITGTVSVRTESLPAIFSAWSSIGSGS